MTLASAIVEHLIKGLWTTEILLCKDKEIVERSAKNISALRTETRLSSI